MQRYHCTLIIFHMQLKQTLGAVLSCDSFLQIIPSHPPLSLTTVAVWCAPSKLCTWSCHCIKPTRPLEGLGVGVTVLLDLHSGPWGQCNVRNLLLSTNWEAGVAPRAEWCFQTLRLSNTQFWLGGLDLESCPWLIWNRVGHRYSHVAWDSLSWCLLFQLYY